MSTLLAVSSAHDTVHIFKLGKQGAGKKSNPTSIADPTSPSGSVDEASAIEGGYEAFMESKQKGGMGQMIKRRSQLVTKQWTNSVGGYLPSTITEIWEPARDFAWLKLPTTGARCAVALSGTMPQVMVISSEGYFYSYNIDLENGGECSLMKQYSLLDSDEASGATD